MTEYKLIKTNHRLYRIWYGMRYRCDSPNYPKYHRYGGRGITYCKAWEDFETFVKDMDSTYTPGLTLDRKNNDGDYSPENCEWISRQINSKKDTSKGMNKYTLNGKFIEKFEAMSDVCVHLGLAKNHGSINRAHKEMKPFMGFRWMRKDNEDPLLPEECSNVLVIRNEQIKQLDKETNKIINIWDSAAIASETLKISDASISQVCKGKRKSAGGFGWSYE